MDSGDRSDNRLKASDSGFGGFRSQSFSNLFQGFFGVKQAPTSVGDIPSQKENASVEGGSLETIVSPSNEDSWILSQFMHGRREKDDDNHLRRNVTCSELGKLEHLRITEPAPAPSSATDVGRAIDDQVSLSRVLRIQVDEKPINEPGINKVEKQNRSEEFTETKIVFPKNVEQFHYPRNMLSSFMSHDLPHGALKQNERDADPKQSGCVESSTSSGPDQRDQMDGSLIPDAMPKEKIPETRHTFKDFLWSFNHEKINVTKKEMNLIASIDQ